MAHIWERLAQTADRSRRHPGRLRYRRLDLVCYDRAIVGQVLEQAGFHREGRHWYRLDLEWEHLSCPWSLGPRTRGTAKYRARSAQNLDLLIFTHVK